MPRIRTLAEADLAEIVEARAESYGELCRQTHQSIDAMLDARGVTNPVARRGAHEKAAAWLESEGLAMLGASLDKFEAALEQGCAPTEH